ncbi:VIP peptides-like [Hypanus sabinus]|uniref:VIP peptides-like n=1 Tax=Hypanus sabinus TaxID=79690 RepID=UPI0028C390AB|nr:VIP peptides-like [Hypanus sabinus]XP_059841277.1 VIP peptides-like [Hypanus sabinus]
MVIKFGSYSVTLLALFNFLCSRGSAFPALGGYSELRLGDAIGLDVKSVEERSLLPSDTDSDASDSENLFYQLSANFPSRVTRHSDGLFTSEFSKILSREAARRYLAKLKGKRTGLGASKREVDDIFGDNYSRIQKEIMLKKMIDNLLNSKRSLEDLNLDNLLDTVPVGEN